MRQGLAQRDDAPDCAASALDPRVIANETSSRSWAMESSGAPSYREARGEIARTRCPLVPEHSMRRTGAARPSSPPIPFDQPEKGLSSTALWRPRGPHLPLRSEGGVLTCRRQLLNTGSQGQAADRVCGAAEGGRQA